MQKSRQQKITRFLREQSPSVSAKSLQYFSIKDEISFSQFNSRNNQHQSGDKSSPFPSKLYTTQKARASFEDGFHSIFDKIESLGGGSLRKGDRRNLKSVGYKAHFDRKRGVPDLNQIIQSPSFFLGASVSGYQGAEDERETLGGEAKENLGEYKEKVMRGLQDLKKKLQINSQGEGIQHIDQLMRELVDKQDTLSVEHSVFKALKKIETPKPTPLKAKQENLGKKPKNEEKKNLLGKRNSILFFFQKSEKQEEVEQKKKIKQKAPRIDQIIKEMKSSPTPRRKSKDHTQTRMDRFLVERRSNKNVKFCSLSKLIWIRIMPFLYLRDMARLGSTCHFFKELYRLLFFRMGSFLSIFDSEAHSEREIQELYQKSRSHSHRILRQFFQGKSHKSVLSRTKLKVGFSRESKNGHSFNQLSVGPKTQGRRINTTFLTDSDLQKIISFSRHSLMDLSLDACLMLSHAGFKSIAKLKNLISLRIKRNENICDEHVRDILDSCSFLRKVEISNCSKLTEQSVQHITNLGQKINYLDLSGNQGMFDDFDGFGFFCRIARLRYLVLRKVALSNSQIVQIVRNCPRLLHLDCQGNRRINSELEKMLSVEDRKERLVLLVKSTRIPKHQIVIEGK